MCERRSVFFTHKFRTSVHFGLRLVMLFGTDGAHFLELIAKSVLFLAFLPRFLGFMGKTCTFTLWVMFDTFSFRTKPDIPFDLPVLSIRKIWNGLHLANLSYWASSTQILFGKKQLFEGGFSMKGYRKSWFRTISYKKKTYVRCSIRHVSGHFFSSTSPSIPNFFRPRFYQAQFIKVGLALSLPDLKRERIPHRNWIPLLVCAYIKVDRENRFWLAVRCAVNSLKHFHRNLIEGVSRSCTKLVKILKKKKKKKTVQLFIKIDSPHHQIIDFKKYKYRKYFYFTLQFFHFIIIICFVIVFNFKYLALSVDFPILLRSIYFSSFRFCFLNLA